MRTIDPPPIRPLVEAALKSGDPRFQIRVIAILQARAPTAWSRVLVDLIEMLRGRTAVEVKDAALRAVMALEGPTTVGPDAAVPEAEAQDADQTAPSRR